MVTKRELVWFLKEAAFSCVLKCVYRLTNSTGSEFCSSYGLRYYSWIAYAKLDGISLHRLWWPLEEDELRSAWLRASWHLSSDVVSISSFFNVSLFFDNPSDRQWSFFDDQRASGTQWNCILEASDGIYHFFGVKMFLCVLVCCSSSSRSSRIRNRWLHHEWCFWIMCQPVGVKRKWLHDILVFRILQELLIKV